MHFCSARRHMPAVVNKVPGHDFKMSWYGYAWIWTCWTCVRSGGPMGQGDANSAAREHNKVKHNCMCEWAHEDEGSENGVIWVRRVIPNKRCPSHGKPRRVAKSE